MKITGITISVNAAVHLTAAKSIIIKIDLNSSAVVGGSIFDNNTIMIIDGLGFGIKEAMGIVYR